MGSLHSNGYQTSSYQSTKDFQYIFKQHISIISDAEHFVLTFERSSLKFKGH